MPLPGDHAPRPADDLTIVIPYRADVPERRENLAAVLVHLARIAPGVDILLIEDGPDPVARGLPNVPGLRHVAFRNTGTFHRTRLLNLGIEHLTDRPFAAAHDTDTLPYPQALAEGLALLRAGFGLVYPFDGRFIDLRGSARARLLSGSPLPDPAILPRHRRRWWQWRGDVLCQNEGSVGGVVLFARRAFIRGGGYHEEFRSWGFEDDEIKARMEKLATVSAHVSGWPLLHLAHPRKGSTWYRSVARNRTLFRRMAALDRAQTEALIASGALRASGDES